jgi:site-specific DNA-methyltransferase (adenine-specific)
MKDKVMTKEIQFQENGTRLYNADCREAILSIPDNSIELIATDPPYFIDGMDNSWSHKRLRQRESNRSSQTSAVDGMPTSMKFSPNQGRRLQEFFDKISPDFFRVLKPGGFMVAFAQPRLFHRMVVAIEDVGFEIRDMCIWEHKGGQGKAFKFDSRVLKDSNLNADQKVSIITAMDGRKTPQIRPKHEPFVIAQKPIEGTFVQNFIKWGVGLVRMEFGGHQQSTVFDFNKPKLRKKYDHMTIKPQELMERIIDMFTSSGQTVFDPFMGSGTTGAAARKLGRFFVGIEIEKGSYNQAKKRIEENQ